MQLIVNKCGLRREFSSKIAVHGNLLHFLGFGGGGKRNFIIKSDDTKYVYIAKKGPENHFVAWF